MRCHDDYAWNGCYFHGPFDPQGTSLTVTQDFFVFCILAQRRVLPPDWPWGEYLRAAGRWVKYVIDKSEASERGGGENVFSALTGGRSLRYTAEVVYGSSCMNQERSPEHSGMLAVVEGMPVCGFPPAALDCVGGVEAWEAFARGLHFENANLGEEELAELEEIEALTEARVRAERGLPVRRMGG